MEESLSIELSVSLNHFNRLNYSESNVLKDSLLHIMDVLYEGMGDDKYAPAPLLIKMVDDGLLGGSLVKVSTNLERLIYFH